MTRRGLDRGRSPADKPAELARQAASWHLLSLLFERPRKGWHARLEKLASELGDKDLMAAAEAAREAREEDYHQVFAPGRASSPREASCAGMTDPGRNMAELAGLYKAFAFKPSAEEPSDHVAVEAAFAGFLCLKESYALAGDAAEDARSCRRARELFIDGHLARLGKGMARKMPGSAPAWLRLAARALGSRLPIV
ncbi:MAG: molecular chaperone TorD family protein [Elusimicrobia bacterium]|nr:molecular chaperone TorD family protein [Elusimicrobiota bacterium]